MDRRIELILPARKGAADEPPDHTMPSFLFERMTGWEGLGRPFWYDLDLLCRDGHVDKLKVLGQPMAVAVESTDLGEPRYFHGIITRLTQMGWTGEYFRYRAQLRPQIWLLNRTTNSRILEPQRIGGPMTVPKILTTIFGERGIDYDDELLTKAGFDYLEHEYVVQYQETELNFVSRLMERVGIYYYFKHEKDRHTLVLADDVASLTSQGGYEEIPYFPPDSQTTDRRERDHIDSWTVEMQVEPGAYVGKDFDFRSPNAPLLAPTIVPKEHAEHQSYEVFEYPARHLGK